MLHRTAALLLGLAPLTVPAPAVPQECVALQGVDDRCESWVSIYDNADGRRGRVGSDRAFALALSPAGDRVFTAGWSFEDASDSNDIKALAFDAATGSPGWTARIDGEAHGDDWGNAVGVSPEGDRVFVAGYLARERPGTSDDRPEWVVAALDASDGRERWRAVPADGRSAATALAALGDMLFVAGSIAETDAPSDFLIVAYRASTGEELWRAGHGGPGGGYDGVEALAASPDGTRVFVTGYQDLYAGDPGDSSTTDIATVAYDTEEGDELWAARYGTERYDRPADLAVSPDGRRVFVAGNGGGDYTVVAYAAETGEREWAVDYHGAGQMDVAEGVAVSPDGRRVYVTGTSSSDRPNYLDYATLALDASTGQTMWVARYAGPGQIWEFAADVAVAPAGERVFVTGWSAPNYGWTRGGGSDGSVEATEETFASAATVAYDADTGAQAWAARFNSSPVALDADYPAALTLSPDGRRAYVAGTFVHPVAVREPGLVEGMNFADVGVLAYDAFP